MEKLIQKIVFNQSGSGKKALTLLLLFIAAFCLLRAVSVEAKMFGKGQVDVDEEVYDSEENAQSEDGEDVAQADQVEKRDIQLSHPDEALARVMPEKDDPRFAQVEGVEKLNQAKEGAIDVPRTATAIAAASASESRQGGRALASESRDLAPKLQKATAAVSNEASAATEQLTAMTPAPAGVAAVTQDAQASQATTVAQETARVGVREEFLQRPVSAQYLARGKPAYAVASSEQAESKSELSGRSISSIHELNHRIAAKVVGHQEISLIVSDQGFFPSRLVVTQGVPVKVYLSTPGKNVLCFMMDQWALQKGVAPGQVEEVSFMPDKAGDFRFYCPVKSIEGKLTVRPSGRAKEIY